MHINKVTITGADNNTSVTDLQRLSVMFPFVEWGILFSASRKGNPRYPDYEWIRNLAGSGLSLSAHYCGWWSKEILENQNFELIDKLASDFKRVQINYNFTKSKGWNTQPVLRYAKDNPSRAIIFQYNKSNAHALDFLLGMDAPSNIHILHDASGGRGTEIEHIGRHFKSNYTGYSGGINPLNVDSVCAEVSRAFDYAPFQAWIDLESGVRDSINEFSLRSVAVVLKKAELFVNHVKT